MAAYALSRWRGGYQQPAWMRLFIKVQAFDLAQGAIFTGLSIYHVNNQWLRHLTQPIVFMGFLGTMFQMVPASRNRRRLYGTCLGIGLAAALAGAALDGMQWRNSVFTSTMSFLYLGLVTRELRALAGSDEAPGLTSLPAFWVLSALLVYSSGTLIFNASSNYFLRALPPQLVLIPWVVVSFIHAVHEILLAKAFLCPKHISS